MTLKEKFNIISCNDCNMPYCDIKCTMLSEYELNKLEQISDDYAIGFARFYKMANNNEYHLYPNASIEEHLEIYKEESGL